MEEVAQDHFICMTSTLGDQPCSQSGCLGPSLLRPSRKRGAVLPRVRVRGPSRLAVVLLVWYLLACSKPQESRSICFCFN